mgnify:CR=1 FL=1
MNKRIEELAELAAKEVSGNAFSMARYNEKFAELIVQECISLFDGTKEIKTVGVLTHDQVIKQIKQHFGVE